VAPAAEYDEEDAVSRKPLAQVLSLVGMVALATLLAESAQQDLATALTFHASFDKEADADFGLGDKRIYTAPSYKTLDAAQPGIHNPDVSIVPGKGRHGRGARIQSKEHHSNLLSGREERRLSARRLERHGLLLVEPEP
jgi:hypothetical protein